MNYSTKSTYPLFESISVVDGIINNESFHRKRFITSYRTLFNSSPYFDLFEDVEIPVDFQRGHVKFRISYGLEKKHHSFENYQKKTVKTLKLIKDDSIEYHLKFEDRSAINRLFDQKNECDDILIVKNDHITDSSYANVVFFTGKEWVTPNKPLLKGTMRASLLKENEIRELPIRPSNLKEFIGFQLVNAMLGFDSTHWLPIDNIK